MGAKPMADEPTIEEPDQTAPEPPSQQGDPEPLGEGGKKALDAERRARRDAEKELQALRSQLDAYEAEKLTKEEKAAKDAAAAIERAVKAEDDADVWRLAAEHGSFDEDDLELLRTVSDKDARAKLASRLAVNRPAKGTVVPGVGNRPAQPASIAEQIAVAEQSGDHNTALMLKAQQIAELARNQK